MLLMGILIADTHTFSKKIHMKMHTFTKYFQNALYITQVVCFIKQLLPHSLFKCQLYLGETNYRGFF